MKFHRPASDFAGFEIRPGGLIFEMRQIDDGCHPSIAHHILSTHARFVGPRGIYIGEMTASISTENANWR